MGRGGVTFTLSLARSLTHSLTHSLTQRAIRTVHKFIHSFVYTHSLSHSFIQSLAHSFTYALIRSLRVLNLFVYILIHTATESVLSGFKRMQSPFSPSLQREIMNPLIIACLPNSCWVIDLPPGLFTHALRRCRSRDCGN